MSDVQPSTLLEGLEAEMAQRERVLAAFRLVADAVRQALGVPASTPVAVTVCPPIGRQGRPESRASVRRGRAKAAKALRTKGGRRKAAADGSLPDRILSTLGSAGAPVKKSAIVDEAKAREADVTAELKRLRDDGQIVVVGQSRWARWSLPKFANVIVADTD